MSPKMEDIVNLMADVVGPKIDPKVAQKDAEIEDIVLDLLDLKIFVLGLEILL